MPRNKKGRGRRRYPPAMIAALRTRLAAVKRDLKVNGVRVECDTLDWIEAEIESF